MASSPSQIGHQGTTSDNFAKFSSQCGVHGTPEPPSGLSSPRWDLQASHLFYQANGCKCVDASTPRHSITGKRIGISALQAENTHQQDQAGPAASGNAVRGQSSMPSHMQSTNKHHRLSNTSVSTDANTLPSSHECTIASVSNDGAFDEPPERAPPTMRWWQRAAVRVTKHPDFELTVILLVLLNCVALSLYAPLEGSTYLGNVIMTKTGVLTCAHIVVATCTCCAQCNLPTMVMLEGWMDTEPCIPASQSEISVALG
jgi:hypothetical protein